MGWAFQRRYRRGGIYVPAPVNSDILVSNMSQLNSAVATITGNGGYRNIIMADGTYTQGDALYINVPGVGIKGQSGVATSVILQGDGDAPFNIRIAAPNLVIEDITLGGACEFSALQIVGENTANAGRVSRCILRDSTEHLVKATTGAVTGAEDWVIEDCSFLFTSGRALQQYSGGIDAHRAARWNIRRNTFRDIASPADSACQHAINLWNGSNNNIIERNKVIDCDRGIGDGLNAVNNPANSDNIVRNNMVYHSNNGDSYADVGIATENSINSKIFNNTVYFANSFTWCMEYRYTTTGAQIRNNLCNKQILQRNGATATLSNNVINAQASYFVNVSTGDLRLASAVAGVVDAGVLLADVPDDYEGNTRNDPSMDIGADEYIPSSVLNPRSQSDNLIVADTAVKSVQRASGLIIIRTPSESIVTLDSAINSSLSGNPFDLPRYDKTKITYLRKFLVPNGGSALNGSAGLQYGSRPAGLAFNPAGNQGAGSLFISGGPNTWDEVICEMTIPTVNGARAAVLQNFQLTGAGKQGNMQQGELGTMCTGLAVYDGRILSSWCSFYSDVAMPTAYMARSSLTLSGGTCTNPQRVGTLNNQRYMTGLGCPVPTNWRGSFGNYPFIGGGAGACSLASNYGCGPSMVLFDPANLTGSGVVPGKELAWYTLGDITVAGPTGSPGFSSFDSALWTNNSFHRGIVWLPESRTVMCFGKHGDSVYNGANTSTVKVRTRIWLYDATDLKRVYDGSLSPSAVRPYDVLDLDTGPSNAVPQTDEVRSCTWDSVGRKLYVMAGHEEGSFPSIFVFSIPI